MATTISNRPNQPTRAAVLPTVFKILAVIAVAETAVMVILEALHLTNGWRIALDLMMLTGFTAPLLYWFVVGPIHDAHRKRRQAERRLKKTAAALRSANKVLEELKIAARAATRAKSEFLANVSHEIRTPMTAILGYLDVIAEGCPKRCEFGKGETGGYIGIIKGNGDYLLGLIDNILALSGIEAGKVEIQQVACSPCEIISGVVSLMRVRSEAKGLSLDAEYEGAMPQTIRTDPARLRQILINLIGNAIKFTEAGGVRVVTSLQTGNGDAPKLVIRVIDTGIGMPAEQASRLFRQFAQADSSTGGEFGGTGFGLTISKRLAKMLGGDVAVTSFRGQGSTFSVTVDTGPLDDVQMLGDPAEATTETAPEAKPAPEPKIKLDCRVLLVEDGSDNQRLISLLLRQAGADVQVAENGSVGVDLALAARADENPFDVILMDMQMPVMDGYEATRRLQEEGYLGPIIALTAHAMSHDRKKCLDAGCDEYLTKPIDRGKLLRVVGEALRKKRAHPEMRESHENHANPRLAADCLPRSPNSPTLNVPRTVSGGIAPISSRSETTFKVRFAAFSSSWFLRQSEHNL